MTNVVIFFNIPVRAHRRRYGFRANDLCVSLPAHLNAELELVETAVHALGPKSSEILETAGSIIRLYEYVSNLIDSIPTCSAHVVYWNIHWHEASSDRSSLSSREEEHLLPRFWRQRPPQVTGGHPQDWR